jgi:hypothetical protein
MSLRISSAIAVLLVVSACSQGGEVQAQAEEGADAIECAIGPGSDFGPDCLVERVSEGDAQVLVVRHANGGFRRFEQLPDGAGLAAFDGADPVKQSLDGDMLVIEIAGDRYRFPARAKADAAGQ